MEYNILVLTILDEAFFTLRTAIITRPVQDPIAVVVLDNGLYILLHSVILSPVHLHNKSLILYMLIPLFYNTVPTIISTWLFILYGMNKTNFEIDAIVL